MRLAKSGKEPASYVWSFVQQTHDLELAQPYLLQCDRLFQPWLNKQIGDNVGLEKNRSMIKISSITVNHFVLEYICSYSVWPPLPDEAKGWMKIDEIKGAAVKPKDTVKVETVNGLKVILTKDDLRAMINAMDVVYNLMDDTNTITLKLKGSMKPATFSDVSSICSKWCASTSFY